MSKVWDDLAAWENGDLTFAELQALHPEEAVGSLVALQDRLSAFSTESATPPPGAWQALRAEIRGHSRATNVRTHRFRLALGAGLAAATLAGAAYAAPPLRHGVGTVAGHVKDVFTGGHPKSEPTPHPSGTAHPTPNGTIPMLPGTAPRAPSGEGSARGIEAPPPSARESGGAIETPEPSANPNDGNDGDLQATPEPTPADDASVETPAPTQALDESATDEGVQTPQPSDSPGDG